MCEPIIDSMTTIPTFERELGDLINRYSKENGSNTPDFLLADYLVRCLENWNLTVQRREKWYGREPKRSEVQLPSPTIE
jgi:hypothetical protein